MIEFQHSHYNSPFDLKISPHVVHVHKVMYMYNVVVIVSTRFQIVTSPEGFFIVLGNVSVTRSQRKGGKP